MFITYCKLAKRVLPNPPPFHRIHFQPGEEKKIEFVITPEMLTMLNKDLEEVIESGEFSIMIGASSKDIRLKKTIVVK